jgi:3'-phosphoadenosine 5'-phosphosulfate sulfotransferase (PAPS reductase)/FAD synthetase
MLTILSSGIGQDSVALNLLAVYSDSFKQKYIKGDLIVVHSDTRDEHPETRAYIPKVEALCKTWGIEFYHLTADKGFHSPGWAGGVRETMRKHNTVITRSMRSCTDGTKITPIYNFIEWLLHERYGYPIKRKQGFYDYQRDHGNLRVIIGFAKGEEKRVARASAAKQEAFAFAPKENLREPVYMTKTVDRIYPLIDLGMDRQACQEYIKSCGMEVPPPSNCITCPHKDEHEILWTSMAMPNDFQDWVGLEDAKIRANAGKIDKQGKPIRNLGVKGEKLLPQIVAETRALYSHMSDADLLAFLSDRRMSRGHNVCTAY